MREIGAAGEAYGGSQRGAGRRIQVEFVSSNPTGPLHVGHGRNAAFGAVLANLLDAVGFEVQREYYVNDIGRQMDTLALSVWLRYLERRGEQVAFSPPGATRVTICTTLPEPWSRSTGIISPHPRLRSRKASRRVRRTRAWRSATSTH